MSKGYLVANIRVIDQDKFQAFSGMAALQLKNMAAKCSRDRARKDVKVMFVVLS